MAATSLLRDVRLTDVDVYRRLRCDPAMMAELGGPQPPEGIPDKVRRDVESARSGESWISMIVPNLSIPQEVAGTVTLWSHEDAGESVSEIGWMVLPEFQGHGLAKRAVHEMLERAGSEPRWGVVHAYPSVTNGPSNGICRSLGFTLHGPRPLEYNGTTLRCNDWSINSQAPR